MSKNTGGSGKDTGKSTRPIMKYKGMVDNEDDEDDLLKQDLVKEMFGKLRSPPGKTRGDRQIHIATSKTNADIDNTEGRRGDGGGGGGAINPDLVTALMLGNLMKILIIAKQTTSPPMARRLPRESPRDSPVRHIVAPPRDTSGRAGRIGGSNRNSSRPRTSSSLPAATVSVSSGPRPESGTTEQQCDQISEAIQSSGQRIALKLEEMHRDFHQQENQATERTVAELTRIRVQFTEQINKLMQSVRGTTNDNGSERSPSSSTKPHTDGNQKSSQ